MRFPPLLSTGFAAGLLLGAATMSSGCDEPVAAKHLHGQVHLTLIHTADMHSRLFPYDLELGQVDAGLGLGAANTVVNVGGAARLSHIVGRERAQATRVLHLDGGDCFQGAPIFNYFYGEAEVRTESAIGTDVMVIANHEFDKGALNLGTQLQRWATFPVLAANYLFDNSSTPGASPLASIAQPYMVFDLQGLRVGVIGMGNLSSLTSIFDEPNRLGIYPLETIETAQAYTDLLRPMVNVVVVVSHLGLTEDESMIQGTEGIDVVLGGHNHIVLQPPKRVQDCSTPGNVEPDGRHYILLNDPVKAGVQNKRYCTPRDVILAHSGAFAKFVGRLDLIVSNDKRDFAVPYDPAQGFEVVTSDYTLFPVTEETPSDPIVEQLLEPYAQQLDAVANLKLLVGYAQDGSKRSSTSGGDAALGNLISTAMWLRVGVQTDFSLTNTTGIRADLVPGPVTVEQMYNIFPFDNTISKMQLSGTEVQELFDFVAQRSAGRGCVSQAQIAGARVLLDCSKTAANTTDPGTATGIYIGAYNPKIACQHDSDCPPCAKNSNATCPPGECGDSHDHCVAESPGICDNNLSICWQPIDPYAGYELATSNYLAQGGSGFFVLQRNTTQHDTGVEQRDALVDYIRAADPCGVDPNAVPGSPTEHDAKTCSDDAGCASLGDGFVCACPETAIEGDTCGTDAGKTCPKGHGACVLAQCRDDVAAINRATCAGASADVEQTCLSALAPCAQGGEQCKYLGCVDRSIGNFADGRIEMKAQ